MPALLVACSLALFTPKSPTLDEVYRKVERLRGASLSAEVVRPMSVLMQARLAPGFMRVKYPTSEQFVSLTETVTWLPDTREFVRGKAPESNPMLGGFEPFWPNGGRLTPTGDATRAKFGDRDCWAFPAKAPQGHEVTLYVGTEDLLPAGTIAKAGGQEFECRYSRIDTRPISPTVLKFSPPRDARPYVPRDPRSGLVQPGGATPEVEGADLSGRTYRLRDALKGKRGALINFWFSACVPCVKELPWLARISPMLAERGVLVVGVNPVDPATAARKTATLHKLPYPVLTGPGAKLVGKRFGVQAYPVSVIVDADGKVVEVIPAYDEGAIRTGLGKLGVTLDP